MCNIDWLLFNLFHSLFLWVFPFSPKTILICAIVGFKGLKGMYACLCFECVWMCVAFRHERELWCNMRNVPKIPQRHYNTHVSFITVLWSLENCLPTACPKCFIPPVFSNQTYHSVFSGFTWLYFHMIDWRCSWGNAHLAVFKCVITKLVGATYYQQSTCFLPSYFVKATVLPSEMTKICPFFLYVARASCIC